MNGKTGPKATKIRVIVYDHNIPSVCRNARLSSVCGIAHAFFNLPHLVQVAPYMFRLKLILGQLITPENLMALGAITIFIQSF